MGTADEKVRDGIADDFMARRARLVAETDGLRRRLRQDRVWVDVTGREHVVAEMERRHAANVVRWLEGRARTLHAGEEAEWLFLPEPNGEQAGYAFDDEMNRLMETPPLDWLRQQPLMRALVARADGHRGGPSWRYRVRRLVGRG